MKIKVDYLGNVWSDKMYRYVGDGTWGSPSLGKRIIRKRWYILFRVKGYKGKISKKNIKKMLAPPITTYAYAEAHDLPSRQHTIDDSGNGTSNTSIRATLGGGICSGRGH